MFGQWAEFGLIWFFYENVQCQENSNTNKNTGQISIWYLSDV